MRVLGLASKSYTNSNYQSSNRNFTGISNQQEGQNISFTGLLPHVDRWIPIHIQLKHAKQLMELGENWRKIMNAKDMIHIQLIDADWTKKPKLDDIFEKPFTFFTDLRYYLKSQKVLKEFPAQYLERMEELIKDLQEGRIKLQ